MQSDTDRTATERRRLTVQQAAEAMGISAEAVRQRIKRDTIPHERDGGTVYVILAADTTRQDADPTDDRTGDRTGDRGDRAELVDELRARVEDLRDQLAEEREARRRADTIIAQLARANEEQARTIRELEPAVEHSAPPEAPGARESAAPETSKGTTPPPQQTGTQRRSIWSRIFGG